jgi:hypothetical protein
VIAMMTAATTHATDIQRPPDTIQSTLSKKDKNDIGNDPGWLRGFWRSARSRY